MKEKISYGVFTTRNVIVLACIALIVLLGAAAIAVAVTIDTGEMGEQEAIMAKIEELGDGDLGHDYVASHILEFGIGGFDAGKFRRVERYFIEKYPDEMPSVGAIAHKTAKLFMENYYGLIDKADRELMTTALLDCYTRSTGDEYAVYRTETELEDFSTDMSGTFVGIGVSVYQKMDPVTKKLIEVKVADVINDSGAKEAGVLPNDLIVAVDGTPISEYDSRALIMAIRGEVGTTVDITVMRGVQELVITCERRRVVEMSVDCAVKDGIAYIEITSFKSNTPELFGAALTKARLAGVKGIIFDLRNNPGGYLDSVISSLNMLVPAGVRIASYVEADGKETVHTSDGSGRALDVPVVVMCNGNTASAGELFTAALRDWDAEGIVNARIVGEKTYGKGVMQTTFKLYDGTSITLTTAYYNPPSNVNYNGRDKGIVPDVVFDKTGDEEAGWTELALSEVKKMMSGEPAGNNPNTSL